LSQTAALFDTGHIGADIARRSARGVAATVTAQGLKFAVQTTATMVLARLLTPADFGLVAMVAAFTGFVGLFKDLGLSIATVQRREINHAQISSLFWTNVGLSVVLMGVVAMAAPAVAGFYNEPRLMWITIAVGGTFILGGLSTQHTALLQRQMRFEALAAIQVVSLLAGSTAGIVLAWRGAGYWSLVAMSAVTALTDAIMVWSVVRWRPGRPGIGRGVIDMLRFGRDVTAFNCLNYLSRNVDNVLIGNAWGPGALGIYSRAYSLLLFPLQQVNAPIAAVAIPALSRLQGNPAQFRRYYCRMVQLIAYVAIPLVMLLAILANEVVLIVLGDQWVDAARIFRIFSLFAMSQSILTTVGWVLASLGRTRRMLALGIVTAVCVVVAFAIGLPWGPVGVAWAGTIAFTGLVVPNMIVAFENTPVSLADVWESVWRPVVLSCVMGAGAAMAHRFTESLDPFMSVVLVTIASLATAAVTVSVWRTVREDAWQFARLALLVQR
jgi:PST family polysaccharide transporter